MQDITEQQELAQEISDAISKPVGFGEDFDEVRDRVSCLRVFMVKMNVGHTVGLGGCLCVCCDARMSLNCTWN